MKRVSLRKQSVLVFVGVLFFALTGCDASATPSEADATNAWLTLTAVFTTPPATGTPVPNNKALVQILNTALGTDVILDDLSKALDAHYEVMDIGFVPPDGELLFLQIYVRCTCVKNASCCTPERTFVVIADAMKAAHEQVTTHMPNTILEVEIICLNGDHSIGMVRVGWVDLESYITNGTVGGYQLGSRTQIEYMP